MEYSNAREREGAAGPRRGAFSARRAVCSVLFVQLKNKLDQLRGFDVNGIDIFENTGEKQDDLRDPADKLGLGFLDFAAALQLPDGPGVEIEMVPDEFFDNFTNLVVFKAVEYDVDQDPHVLLVEKEFFYAKEGRDQGAVVLVEVQPLHHADLVTLYLVKKILDEGDIELFPGGEIMPEAALGKSGFPGNVFKRYLRIHILFKAPFKRVKDMLLFLDHFKFFFHYYPDVA